MSIWYAAYGSNLCADRFGCYLAGGCPPGASRTYPGARDRTLPTGVRPLALAGCVYFAWHSATWDGGIAFYDPDGPGSSACRAYRLTPGQLSDLLEQEMHRQPGIDHDLGGLLEDGVAILGEGRYESLHVVGELDGEQVVTFTSPERMPAADHSQPSPAYLATMAQGLVESQGWDGDRVAAYLLDRPGIGAWDATGIQALLA